MAKRDSAKEPPEAYSLTRAMAESMVKVGIAVMLFGAAILAIIGWDE